MAYDFDPELACSEANRRGQAAIRGGLAEIGATARLVSRGNRVTLLDTSGRAFGELLGLARQFGSLGFFLSEAQVAGVRAGFVAAGLQTTSFVLYRTTLRACAHAAGIVGKGVLDRWACGVLGSTWPLPPTSSPPHRNSPSRAACRHCPAISCAGGSCGLEQVSDLLIRLAAAEAPPAAWRS